MRVMELIGRPLSQWDIGRKLMLDRKCCEGINFVRFCSEGDAEALPVKVKDEDGLLVAEIPNILLQNDRILIASATMVAADSTQTFYRCSFISNHYISSTIVRC